MEATLQSTAADISRSADQILAKFTGRAPKGTRTVVSDDSVLILLKDTLTKGEQTLADEGRGSHVLEQRREFQGAMEEDLISAVEDATGRKVIACMSGNNIDPDMSAEVFVLEPLDNGAK